MGNQKVKETMAPSLLHRDHAIDEAHVLLPHSDSDRGVVDERWKKGKNNKQLTRISRAFHQTTDALSSFLSHITTRSTYTQQQQRQTTGSKGATVGMADEEGQRERVQQRQHVASPVLHALRPDQQQQRRRGGVKVFHV